MHDSPPIRAECPKEGGRLNVLLFTNHGHTLRNIVTDALRVIARHPDASRIQFGECVTVGGEYLMAMELETPEAAEQIVGHALPSDVDVLAFDGRHRLIVEGLIEERTAHHKGNASCFPELSCLFT